MVSFILAVKNGLEPWPSCLEHCHVNRKVTGSIPGQGTYLGCGFDPRLGCMWEATYRYFSHQCFSLFLPSSLCKISKLSLDEN